MLHFALFSMRIMNLKAHVDIPLNHTLDFSTLLKVSRMFNCTIHLEELIVTLCQTMIENSGADRCALILPQKDEWQVRVIANLEKSDLQTTPLENNSTVPVELIWYVKNTLKLVVWDRFNTSLTSVIDDYLNQHQPESVLCLPIINQENLIGILYLENRSTCGVFSRDRLSVLNFLSNQAAIALENTRLHNVEKQKSQELQEQATLLAFRAAIDSEFTHCGTLQEMLQRCTEILVEHLGAAFARIWTTNAQCDMLELQASAGMYTHLDGAHRCVPVGQFKIGLIAEECRPHLTNDVLNDSRVGDKAWAKREGMVSFAGYPLVIDDQVLGVVALFARQPLSDRVLGALGIVAHEISLGLCRKRAEIALRESESQLRHKSQALEQALLELQQTQLQMVQSEKMSALGNLIAGVAHEINNPVGCIVGNINVIRDSIDDLFSMIDLYGKKFPQPGAEIEAELEAIDLEYLRDDLPKLVKAMKDGGDRIKSISKSLCTFSRADSDQKQIFNLHEGIDSTVLILRHRLKSNEYRLAIEVITEYGDIPAVNCFPGQVNQVFMNILANAIDALDESCQKHRSAKIKNHSSKIKIQTGVEGDSVFISIADTGTGMSEEVKTRIFDHLFTTKDIIKGTGLGLAIAQQIIVEKHGGAIAVTSEVGKGTEFVLTLPIY